MALGPLNVNQSGGGGGILNDIEGVMGQVQGQKEKFGQMLNDPNFTGQSEMSSMLKLQREVAQEQMLYQTASNLMKARTDTVKNTIANLR